MMATIATTPNDGNAALHPTMAMTTPAPNDSNDSYPPNILVF